jgi:hypothetical protein
VDRPHVLDGGGTDHGPVFSGMTAKKQGFALTMQVQA